MCGIFGVVVQSGTSVSGGSLRELTEILFKYSESRGKESAGVTILNAETEQFLVFKEDLPAGEFVRKPDYLNFLNAAIPQSQDVTNTILMGHSRMVTNGTEKNNANNQPVTKLGCTLVHNGIVTNVDALWEDLQDKVSREASVDTEVLGAMLALASEDGGLTADDLRELFATMQGGASVGTLFEDARSLLLATNTGSLYTWYEDGVFIFGSEHFILAESVREWQKADKSADIPIRWLKPMHAVACGLQPAPPTEVDLVQGGAESLLERSAKALVPVDMSGVKGNGTIEIIKPTRANLLEYHEDAIGALKRCTRCILPETFPYISFDAEGVCNFCANTVSDNRHLGTLDEFKEVLSKFRRDNGERDCIVPFSGGRDSSYGLHILKNELGMNPLTFTYDWGMVTDLARRNIALMCGELGVENILVSADIKKKRSYIRKNVLAWLKRPELGMVPLFMAGDKYFFYYVNKVKRETGIEIDIWSSNRYENTDFKSGFSGIPPSFEKKRVSSLSKLDLMRLPWYYAKQFAMNPRYVNSSIPDTLGAYWSYYFEPRTHFHLMFDYVEWKEEEVEDCLINEYGWETHPETKSTWRIGDGTAAFYNYIYTTVAGFSEFDTFRSNQIRAGAITREEAMSRVPIENRPNFEWFQWYCDTNEIDYESLARGINAIPKLYPI